MTEKKQLQNRMDKMGDNKMYFTHEKYSNANIVGHVASPRKSQKVKVIVQHRISQLNQVIEAGR